MKRAARAAAVFLAPLATFAIPSAAAAAQRVALAVDHHATVGEAYALSSSSTTNITSELQTAAGTSNQRTETHSEHLDARVQVLEVDAKGREARLTYTISRCTATVSSQARDLVPAGSVLFVTVAKPGAMASMQLKDGKIDPKDAKLLVPLLCLENPNAPTDGELCGTDTPRAVGEAWPTSTAALLKLLRVDGISVDPSNLTSTARLAELGGGGAQRSAKVAIDFTAKRTTGLAPSALPADITGTLTRTFPLEATRRFPAARSIHESVTFTKRGPADRAGKPTSGKFTLVIDVESTLTP